MNDKTVKLQAKYGNFVTCSKIEVELPIEYLFFSCCLNGAKLHNFEVPRLDLIDSECLGWGQERAVKTRSP